MEKKYSLKNPSFTISSCWTSRSTFGLTNEPRSARIVKYYCGPVAQLGARFHGMEEVVGSIPTRSTNFIRLESITSRAFARIVQKSYNRPDSGDRKCSLFTRVITRPASTQIQISIIGAAAARRSTNTQNPQFLLFAQCFCRINPSYPQCW
jgi:hypothetical protein